MAKSTISRSLFVLESTSKRTVSFLSHVLARHAEVKRYIRNECTVRWGVGLELIPELARLVIVGIVDLAFEPLNCACPGVGVGGVNGRRIVVGNVVGLYLRVEVVDIANAVTLGRIV